jgi:hypothetical protein
VTPVPLELPLRPAEAAELASLIFDQTEGKALSPELRNRLAARASLLKLETFTPFLGSLERDPVHPSVYYLAVDGETPLLLHIALAAAPTSSIYYKPLLIGRMRRPNGPEIVINAIPFGPADRRNIETFAARINPAFYPLPQGARATITVEEDLPAAFDTFRTIQKRTGKNFAAFSGDHYAVMWAAIRAGWRSPYTTATLLEAGVPVDLAGRENVGRYVVSIHPTADSLNQAEKTYQQIRNARAAAKNSRAFDLELDTATPMTPQFLRDALSFMKELGHCPQLICPGPADLQHLEEMAAAAQQFQVTLSFPYRGEPAGSLRAITKALAGRINYRVRNAAEAELVAESLL